MRQKRMKPSHIVLAVVLLVVLLIECAALVHLVRTILDQPETGGEAAVSDTPAPPDETTVQTPGDTESTDDPAPEQSTQPDETAQPDLPEVPISAADSYAERAEQLLSEMSLYEKVCQMFLITPESLTATSLVTQAGPATQAALEEYPVGGLVYFARNLESSDQVLSMISNTQSYSELGLLIAVDEEGGIVNRLMDTLGTTYINSMFNYRHEGTLTAYTNAATIGADIASYGFNTNFAPVADVWSNEENTVIGRRAYSDDFAEAAELIAAAVEGYHGAGMICTLKHFPGHGDTAEDSHYASAYVSKTADELRSEEFLPFIAGIEAGADMVMIGHLSVPALDDEPATVSKTIVTDILRGELGFDGVVITDSMEMSSVSELYEPDELAVRAIEAGVDLLLEPESFRTALNGVMAALESGRLSEARIDESVLRILTMKLKYGIIA